MKRKNPIALLTAWLGLSVTLAPVVHAQGASDIATTAPARTISGRVLNDATGVYLEGARIEVQGTERSVLSDRGGHYAISAPSGRAMLTVSYTGLDTQTLPVTVEAGNVTLKDIALTSKIYSLEKLVVEGQRESSALAITRQRQADNIKNVVATDAFGQMTDDNVGLFLERVTGVNPETNTGTVRSVMVRGISADLNTVSMDGIQLANTDTSGTNRQFDFLQTSISMLESIEVTKAPTPDMPANSIGGNINMVTRSIFTRKNPRAFNYSFGLTTNVGELADIKPRVEANRRWYAEPIRGFNPSVSFNFTDVFGQQRNLGVTLSYSSNIRFLSTYGNSPVYVVNPLGQPAPITSNAFWVNPAGASTRQNKTVKFEYKWSEQTIVSVTAVHTESYLVNDSRTHTLTAAAARLTPAANEILTEALPASDTRSGMTESAFHQRQNNYRFGAAVVHTFDQLRIDYAATLSKSDALSARSANPDARKGVSGKAIADISVGTLGNIGYIIDRRQEPDWPRMIQTSGPDMYDLRSYQSLTATQNNNGGETKILHGNINVRKNLKLPFPAYLKAGVQYQQENRERFANNFRYNFRPPGGAAPGVLLPFLDTGSWINKTVHGQRQPPWLDFYKVGESIDRNPEQWTEDLTYKHNQRLQANVAFEEAIGAAYAMGHVQWRNLGLLAGLRVEETRTEGNGPKNQATLTAAEQARRNAFAGPLTEEEALRRAEYEFGQRVHAEGKYRNVFPGAHLKYALKSGFTARASYSTSIGRPSLNSIIPNVTINDTSQRVTIANTALKPQRAKNYDVALEYYFEPVGLFSVGYFAKDVKDFIYSDTSGTVASGMDNGFDGNYVGYGITTSANGGFAKYRGLEFSYQQQLTFLPGFLGGLGLNASYTRLETEGNYGANSVTTKVIGFRPRTANFALSYRRSRYDVRLQANWVDQFMRSVSANPAQISYEVPHVRTSAKFSCKLTSAATAYVNWDNIFEESIDESYRGAKNRTIRVRAFPSTVALGVLGRF